MLLGHQCHTALTYSWTVPRQDVFFLDLKEDLLPTRVQDGMGMKHKEILGPLVLGFGFTKNGDHGNRALFQWLLLDCSMLGQEGWNRDGERGKRGEPSCLNLVHSNLAFSQHVIWARL